MRSWPFYGALLLPSILLIALSVRGLWWFGIEIAAFLVVPIIDTVLGPDSQAPSREDVAALETRWSFRIVLYLHVVLQTAALIGCMYTWTAVDLASWERFQMILGMGIVSGGLGITIAHELVHRSARWERWLGYFLLCEVWYMHFGLEHVRGHHRRVGTPADPVTARYGESAWAFLPRAIMGSWISALGMEPKMVGAWTLMQVVWTTAAVLIAGDASLLVLILGQSLVAIILLELVNYVEHYGLRRMETKPGVTERFAAIHAWEARQPASNYLLFKLQRHADHHLHPQRRYQALGVHDESPQLTYGYPLMVMAALVPPLWKRLVHHRLPSAMIPRPGQ